MKLCASLASWPVPPPTMYAHSAFVIRSSASTCLYTHPKKDAKTESLLQSATSCVGMSRSASGAWVDVDDQHVLEEHLKIVIQPVGVVQRQLEIDKPVLQRLGIGVEAGLQERIHALQAGGLGPNLNSGEHTLCKVLAP
eukprot:1994935-Rhodomonas_salina.1